VVLGCLVTAWPIVRALQSEPPSPLPVLGAIPEFQARDQQGQPNGTAKLLGSVWIGTFFSTRCSETCRASLEVLLKVQQRVRNIGPEFHLVALSTDGGHDTPERLAAFAIARGANPRLWRLFDAAPEPVQRAVRAALQAGPDAGASLLEGNPLFLVDRRGRIRGLFEITGSDAVPRILEAIREVVNRGE
jgi:cytochrome oxidase Cu insertion factor (SCO1/SenC/PrrC family)